MRYIVPGGAGFIGSNLADTLAQNHDVVVIDTLATGRRENVEHLLDHPRVTFIEGSITDLDLLTKTFPGADGIFHQAAIPSVPRSVKNPLASNEANVTGTVSVLVAAKDCRVPAVVAASSSSAYGDTPDAGRSGRPRRSAAPWPAARSAASSLRSRHSERGSRRISSTPPSTKKERLVILRPDGSGPRGAGPGNLR